MNKFKWRMAVMSFLSYFFLRLGIFLFAGLILCAFGTRNRMCLAIGVALIAFDLIVSIIETVKMFLIIRNSKHPYIRGVNDAINSDDPYGNMDRLTGALPDDPNVAGGKLAPIFLKQSLKNRHDAASCVEGFRNMCAEKVPHEVFIMQYGAVEDAKNKFSCTLIRKYPVSSGKVCHVYMSMIYDLRGLEEFTGSVSSTEVEGDFFDHVIGTEVYKALVDHKMKDLITGFECKNPDGSEYEGV